MFETMVWFMFSTFAFVYIYPIDYYYIGYQ